MLRREFMKGAAALAVAGPVITQAAPIANAEPLLSGTVEVGDAMVMAGDWCRPHTLVTLVTLVKRANGWEVVNEE